MNIEIILNRPVIEDSEGFSADDLRVALKVTLPKQLRRNFNKLFLEEIDKNGLTIKVENGSLVFWAGDCRVGIHIHREWKSEIFLQEKK